MNVSVDAAFLQNWQSRRLLLAPGCITQLKFRVCFPQAFVFVCRAAI